jgi:hypothetical protein
METQPNYTPADYPLYEVFVGRPEHQLWLSLRDAAWTYDCGYVRCRLGRQTIESYGAFPRAMTTAEERAIGDAADRISGSK